MPNCVPVKRNVGIYENGKYSPFASLLVLNGLLANARKQTENKTLTRKDNPGACTKWHRALGRRHVDIINLIKTIQNGLTIEKT